MIISWSEKKNRKTNQYTKLEVLKENQKILAFFFSLILMITRNLQDATQWLLSMIQYNCTDRTLTSSLPRAWKFSADSVKPSLKSYLFAKLGLL